MPPGAGYPGYMPPMPSMMHPPGGAPHMTQNLAQKFKDEPLSNPNPTIYVQNLNERVKISDLKNALYQLFSHYGEVIEAHAKKNIRMRGQAFVVMQDEETAEAAI